MRVLISYVVEVADDTRRSINDHFGRPGLATRQQIKRWYEQHGKSMDDDLNMVSDARLDRETGGGGNVGADDG